MHNEVGKASFWELNNDDMTWQCKLTEYISMSEMGQILIPNIFEYFYYNLEIFKI